MKFQSWLFIFGLALNLFFIYTFTNYDMAAIGFVTAVDNPMTHEVIITAKGFSPSTLTIRQGDTVMWVSKSERVSVIFSNNPTQRFTSNEIEQGETYNHIYDTEGDFGYVDVNFGYKGTVNVLPTSVTEQPSETRETAHPSEIKNENIPLPASCPRCTQGCSLNTETCSCSCPCQSDSDCDDSNSYTKDYCNKNPVECRNEQIEAQQSQVKSDYKNQIVIVAILLALGIFLYITKVFIMNPKKATMQQKNIQQNNVVQKTKKGRK